MQTISSFQGIAFRPGWHHLDARSLASEVIRPFLLRSPPSIFSSMVCNTAAVQQAFGTKFHPKNPRKVPNWMQFQRVIDNFIKTASVRPLVPAGLPTTPDHSVQQVKDFFQQNPKAHIREEGPGWGSLMGRFEGFQGKF